MKKRKLILIKDKKIKFLSPSLSMGNLVKKNNDNLYSELIRTNIKYYNINKESTYKDYEIIKNVLNSSGLKIEREEKNIINKINNYNKKYTKNKEIYK